MSGLQRYHRVLKAQEKLRRMQLAEVRQVLASVHARRSHLERERERFDEAERLSRRGGVLAGRVFERQRVHSLVEQAMAAIDLRIRQVTHQEGERLALLQKASQRERTVRRLQDRRQEEERVERERQEQFLLDEAALRRRGDES